jgi:beta-glucosidase/6-phospho-beta-glucosidase/beta-galactosidase
MRFGIVAVDRATQARVVKPSGRWLAQVIRANEVI